MTVPLAPGAAITVWSEGDMAHALTPATCDLLAAARPQIVCLHAGPDRLHPALRQLAAGARALVPGVRLWAGIGLDVWAQHAAEGRLADARAHVARTIDLAAELGFEAIVWDAEGASEAHPAVGAELATDLIDDARAAAPHLVQIHTAYDHPTLHAHYPWAAWCGPDGVDAMLPQVYVAEAGPAKPGWLPAREATSVASFAVAVQRGWVRPELIGTGVYLQIHGTPAADLAAVGARYPLVALWCSALVDAAGRAAAVALCDAKRAPVAA